MYIQPVIAKQLKTNKQTDKYKYIHTKYWFDIKLMYYLYKDAKHMLSWTKVIVYKYLTVENRDWLIRIKYFIEQIQEFEFFIIFIFFTKSPKCPRGSWWNCRGLWNFYTLAIASYIMYIHPDIIMYTCSNIFKVTLKANFFYFL